MKRSLPTLTQRQYDLVVIGGGIYGISVARDAAVRGLKVALVDQADFGHATSSNHHKIIHGGFRYLQHIDVKRMRESIRERSILLRMAPHLVHPLPFLIPIYRHCLQSKLLMSLALKLNDLVSLDRNRNLEPHNSIPRGRIISKSEALQFWPDLDSEQITGAAIYFDGQVHNPERLNLALLVSACSAGAQVANYAQVTSFLQNHDQVTGINVRDVLSGDSFPLRAGVVVNCAGPWLERVLRSLRSAPCQRRIPLSKAIVLLTRPLVQNIAVGLPSRFRYTDNAGMFQKGFRYFFITPWRNKALVGTAETPYKGDPDALQVTEQEICNFLSDINMSFPRAALRRRDVYGVLRGLLPSDGGTDQNKESQPTHQAEIHDHAEEDGIHGLISVVGVKYTTARSVAEKAVDLVFKKLGKKTVSCRTGELPVHGGEIRCFEEFLTRALKSKPAHISAESLHHLATTYGSEYRQIIRYCEIDPRWATPVVSDSLIIKAEVLHGIRVEMAQKLSDVVFRRTELGTAGCSSESSIYECAAIMAAELGWSRKRVSCEMDEVQAEVCRRTG